MTEPTTLGTWLRRERERRGVTLTQISEQTKLSLSLLQGLEADDLSRWPGGIFRRSFARSYAAAVGLDPALVVRRVLEEHPDPEAPKPDPAPEVAASGVPVATTGAAPAAAGRWRSMPGRSRLMAILLDVLMACATALGFAAAGTSPLWAVLVLAAYHAGGLYFTGTTPMAALLASGEQAAAPAASAAPAQAGTRESARRVDAPVRRAPRGARRTPGRGEPVRTAERRA